MSPLFKHIIYIFVVSLLLLSCKSDKIEEDPSVPVPEEPQVGTSDGRTVLVYIISDNDNDMVVAAQSDVNEILAGKIYLGQKDHVIIYWDDKSLPRIYDITNKETATTFTALTPVVSYEEEINSCSYEQFTSVLQFVKNNYPAASYGLVMWSHGTGWLPATVSTTDNTEAYGAKTRSFGADYDYVNNIRTGQNRMSISVMRDAIQDFGTFDFILFDACFMQNIEVLYQLRNTAKAIIASAAEVPGPGAPYHSILQPMFQDGNYVEAMVETYYNYYAGTSNYGILLSAVDGYSLNTFAEATRPYILKYKSTLMNMSYSDILDYYQFDRYFTSNTNCYPDYYDMKGVMQRALSDEDYSAWIQEYEKIFITAVHTSRWYSAIMGRTYKSVTESQYSGISMHIPLKKYADKNVWFAAAYYDTDWAKAAWTEAEAQ